MTEIAPTTDLVFMTGAEVADTIKVSRQTLDRLVAANDFPKPNRITAWRLVWLKHEVDEWMRERIEMGLPRRNIHTGDKAA